MALVFWVLFVLCLVLVMCDIVFLMTWSEGLRNRNAAVCFCCLCSWLALWSPTLFRWFKKSVHAPLAPVIFLTGVSQKHSLDGEEGLGWDVGGNGLSLVSPQQTFLSKNPHIKIFLPNRVGFFGYFPKERLLSNLMNSCKCFREKNQQKTKI